MGIHLRYRSQRSFLLNHLKSPLLYCVPNGGELSGDPLLAGQLVESRSSILPEEWRPNTPTTLRVSSFRRHCVVFPKLHRRGWRQWVTPFLVKRPPLFIDHFKGQPPTDDPARFGPAHRGSTTNIPEVSSVNASPNVIAPASLTPPVWLNPLMNLMPLTIF